MPDRILPPDNDDALTRLDAHGALARIAVQASTGMVGEGGRLRALTQGGIVRNRRTWLE